MRLPGRATIPWSRGSSGGNFLLRRESLTPHFILSIKPKKAGPFASLRRAQGGIGSRDANGYTALHYAALNGHKEVVGLLLSYEASCNSVDEAGSSPLHLAAWAGHSEVSWPGKVKL